MLSTKLTDRLQHFESALSSGVFTDEDTKVCQPDNAIEIILNELRKLQKAEKSIFLIGNGGSAAVASHITNDLCNMARVRASALNDLATLTCYANDYGYEDIYARQIKNVAQPGDVLFAISSSGGSENIVRAAAEMIACGGTLFTLSGFRSNNPLRTMGRINFWLDSCEYGIVEIGHLFFLHHIANIFSEICANQSVVDNEPFGSSQ